MVKDKSTKRIYINETVKFDFGTVAKIFIFQLVNFDYFLVKKCLFK